MQFVQTFDEIGTVVVGDDVEDSGCEVALYYSEAGESSCEVADGTCSDDGLAWGAHEMGSPTFCTKHYFPQEQLGYEFYEVENV